jgi:hypothetical protein
MTTPIEMSPAKCSVMLRPRHADPRLRYVRNDAAHPHMTAFFPEDDNLFIHEVLPCCSRNLGYDFARSLSEARCAVKCIRRKAQSVFLMFTSSARVWGQTLRISQQNPLYHHLIPSSCQVNPRCAEASTPWV